MDFLRLAPWALAMSSGALGWSGEWRLLPLALGVVFAWVLSQSRTEAFGVAFAYYAVASLGLVESVAVFSDPAAPRWGMGCALWAGGNALLSSVWGGLWSGSLRKDVVARFWRGGLCAVVLAVPPVGLFGWANPWTAAGVLLPGTGFLGLFLMLLAVLGSTKRTFKIQLGALALASLLCCATYQEGVANRRFVGRSTSFGRIAASDVGTQFEIAVDLGAALQKHPARVALLPEGVGGVWTPTTALLWATVLPRARQTVLVGALERTEGGTRNGLAVLGQEEAWFWPQRVPVPLGMWAPWSEDHIESDLFGPVVYDFRGRRVTLLMCFEQLIAWPVIQSGIVGADIALAPANLWFARDTRVDAIRAASLRAWARLFDWVRVEAVNE